MNRAERKRLEAAGWQVGSVADFLDLTPAEAVYIELRVRLVDALRGRRQAAKLSQKAFATSMKSSQSRIAKAEANDPTVSIDLLMRSLIALGADLGELARILDIQENDRGSDAQHDRAKRKQAKQSGKSSKKNSIKAA